MAETTGETRLGAGSPKRVGSGRSGAAARGRAKGGDLERDLRDFASGRPEGWGHDDWLNFLESLKERGHDIRDRDAIGIALEKERLDLALSAVKGMGPQRRHTLVDRYVTVWNLRNAGVEEIAEAARIPQDLAERVKAEIR